MNVPSATAITVEIAGDQQRVLEAPSPGPGSANGCCQWRSVKPCHVKLKRPLLSLNENRITMKIGMNRYSSAAADQTPSSQVRMRSRGAS